MYPVLYPRAMLEAIEIDEPFENKQPFKRMERMRRIELPS
jgi:hypothetical protein